MAGIRLDHIEKRYGQTSILDDISLDIRDGEFLTLVGPSGCGKSTLLRIIAGLEAQDAGEVSIGGTCVDALRPKARDIAMVFQSYALYPHLSVLDNIALPLRIRRLSFAERFPLLRHAFPRQRRLEQAIRKEVEAAAEMLDISHLLHRKPAQLSGGQRQRVALGRALVRQPAVFLMDEPLSNLDAKLRVQMRTEITALHRRLGTTFVYVTHDQSEALTMSDRVAVMIEGKLLQVAAPETLYRDPQDVRVAEMIGSPKINVVACHAWTGGLPADMHPQAETLAFRPEDARITAPGQGGLEGCVIAIENLGSDLFVTVAITGDRARAVVRMSPDEARCTPGQSVGISADSTRLLQFNAAGTRLCKLRRVAA